MTLVCFPDSVTIPTLPELERAQVLRVFKDSVTAPAGARAGPDNHMMSPRGSQQMEGRDQFICTNIYMSAPGLSVCCPLVSV